MASRTTYIGIGSNLGERRAHAEAALQALAAHPACRVLVCSRWYETEPLRRPADPAPQPWYVNGVASVETRLGAFELVQLLKQIERAAGPRGVARWAPRALDLDLLAYGDEVIETPDLIVPHPGLAKRRFVLEPLAEVAPDWRHPVLGKTVRDMLAACPDPLEVRPL